MYFFSYKELQKLPKYGKIISQVKTLYKKRGILIKKIKIERSNNMSMKLSTDKRYLVLENQKLVHYLVQRIGVTPDYIEYEDLISIGTIGLIKAAITFDESKNSKFSTYASKCINNEIFIHYRKTKKCAKEISLNKTIGYDGDGKELILENIIEEPKSDFIENIIIEEKFIKLIETILNYLKGKKRIIMLYQIGNAKQEEIAKKLNISQSYVSRIEKGTAQQIKEMIKKKIQYKKTFSMEIIEDKYNIHISTKEIDNCSKIITKVIQNIKNTINIKINYSKKRITIQVPAHPESFYFIAQIIEEIEKTHKINI